MTYREFNNAWLNSDSMFNGNNMNEICNKIYALKCKFENTNEYTDAENEACATLYNYVDKWAEEKSCQYNTEGIQEFISIIDNNELADILEYLEVNEPKVYEAYRLVGGTSKFQNYCYYHTIKNELEYIANEFDVK